MSGPRRPCAPGCTCGKHTKRFGADNPAWLGDEPTYDAVHKRLYDNRGPARIHRCLFCAEAGKDRQAEDWAQLPGTSGKHIADYVPLCSACHGRLDAPAQWPASRRAMQSERIRQAHQDGRFPTPVGAPRGELHHGHKLTEVDVRVIRDLLNAGGLSLTAIGARFGVGRKAVARIRDGVYWGWLQ